MAVGLEAGLEEELEEGQEVEIDKYKPGVRVRWEIRNDDACEFQPMSEALPCHLTCAVPASNNKTNRKYVFNL